MGIRDWFKRNKKVVAKKAVPASAPAKQAAPAATTGAKKPATRGPSKAAAKRPQCGAITAQGGQCQNSARAGSKYCGAHKGYQPPSKGAAVKAPDTRPRVAKAPDTKPRGRRAADPTKSTGGLRPQCAALTAAGGQCQNSARANSKYCGAHKGYTPPSRAKASAAKDTKPKVSKAKDTKPSGRRQQVTKFGYGLFQNGNRYFFSKKAQKDVKGTPVYSMPSGYTTTRTPNGLPVLKKR